MLKSLLKVRLLSWKTALIRGNKTSKTQKKTGGKGTALLLLLLFAFVAGEFGFLFYTFFSDLAGGLSAFGAGWFYFTLYALMDVALMVIGGIFTAKATLFESKDNELLFAMPIPPRYILFSRMVSLWLLNMILHLLVTVPIGIAWIVHGTVTAKGVVGYLVLSLVLPLFAMAISAFFGWLLSLISARVRRKSLVTTVCSLIFLALYFVAVSRADALILYILEQGAALSEKFRSVTLLYWIGNVCADGSLWQLALLSLILLLPFALAYLILSVSLLRNVTTKRGFAKIVYREKRIEAVSSERALFRREMRRFFTSPAYIMNAGLGTILTAALGVFLMIKGSLVRELAALLPPLGEMLAPFLVLALCMTGGMGLISAASVSIEGRALWVVRSLPVDTKVILRTKLTVHLALSLPSMLIACIGSAIALRVDLLTTLLLFLVPMLYTVFTALLGLTENLRHPHLNWENETQAVKSGVAVLFSMLITMGVELVFGVVGGVLLFKTELDARVLLAAFALLLALTCVWLYRRLMRGGVRRFEAL